MLSPWFVHINYLSKSSFCQDQGNTEFFDSFLNTGNMFKEDSEPTSEPALERAIKINVENPPVSASTLLDFFNQLQVL